MSMTTKIRENANKVGFIVEQYPEHKLPDVLKLLQMPPIDINTAIWAAEKLGFIGKPNAETGEIPRGEVPANWEFGSDVEDLKSTLVFSFTELGKREKDLTEEYLSTWLSGYPTQDKLVAMKSLLNDRVLAEYNIDDPQLDDKGEPTYDEDGKPVINVYTFYTLFENGENLWGRKDFKKDPVTGESNVEDDDEEFTA